MPNRERGRLTLVDVIYVVVAIAVLSVLYPVYSSVLASNVSELTGAEAFLLQLVLPVALLVVLAVIYREATRGVVG